MKNSTTENAVDSRYRGREATGTRNGRARDGLHGEYTAILGESPQIIEVLEENT